MAVLVEETFGSGIGSFDAGTHVAAEGVDFADGYLSMPTNTTATRSFSAIISGVFRVDFWYRVADSETVADSSKSTFVYLLPTAGSAISTNSICAIHIDRDTRIGHSATTTANNLQYRDGSGFVNWPQIAPFRRGAWVKISIVGNFSTTTYDLYFNDVLWLRAKPFANASAADFSRLVILNNTAAPATHFDNVRVESNWSLPSESALIEHNFVGGSGEIEDNNPITDNRNLYAQPWKIPDNTTYGGFALGANGAAPDASKQCLAMARCRPEGIVEGEFRSSVAGVVHFGLATRVWAGLDGDSYLLLRVFGGANNTISLFQGATQLKSAAFTPSADTTYTLKMEMRGRYLDCYYKADSIDVGSYTLAFSHLIESDATGARGQLSEEHCGPLVDGTLGAADNYVRHFRFTGVVPSDEVTPTIGDATYNICYGSIRGLYHGNVASTQRNLFWSKGIQYGHRAEADMGNYATAQQTIYDGTHIKLYRQRSLNVMEDGLLGVSDVYITISRRGVWLADRITIWNPAPNIAPDHDFRPELWNTNFRYVGATGSSSAANDSPFHGWTNHLVNTALPLAFQRLTGFGSGNQVRFTAVTRNNLNLTDNNHTITSKYLGVGDPISQATHRNVNTTVSGTAYEFGRGFLIESGALALSDAVLVAFRDDVKVPAALTVATGALKTDAAGDLDTDGFNERYGWHEVTCASNGAADFTLPVASGTRYMPAFRLYGWDSANEQIEIGGSVAIINTDYVLDDFGGGIAVLQLLSNRTADTQISVISAIVSTRQFMHYQRMRQ